LLEHPFGEVVGDAFEIVEDLIERLRAWISIGFTLRRTWQCRPPPL
jgi:hypothetical protein